MKAKISVKVEISDHENHFCSKKSICKYTSATYTLLCNDNEIPELYKSNSYGFINNFDQKDWINILPAHPVNHKKGKNCECKNSKESIEKKIIKHDIKITFTSIELLDESTYDFETDDTIDYYSLSD